MRLDQIELLLASGRATASDVRETLGRVYEQLEISGATSLLTSIDVCNTQLSVVMIGIFSLFESRLQSLNGWEKPLEEVQSILNERLPERAMQFEGLRLAINVLKHGEGASHTRLLALAVRLPFQIQTTYGEMHDEGDLCPPSDLILMTPELVEHCCDLIECSWELIRQIAKPTPPL